MPDQRVSDDHTGHLSIGEVLGLLLEEFPEVTISKIRFLESQGLIDPERTPSGYRKFYDDDVELLRCILREQRENFLPLKVIKDRLDSGEIDPTNENTRPRGIRNVAEPDGPDEHPADGSAPDADEQGSAGDQGAASARARRQHPSAGQRVSVPTSTPTVENGSTAPTSASRPSGSSTASRPAPGERGPLRFTVDELCAESGLTPTELGNLESYAVLSAIPSAGGPLYDEDGLEIARCCKRFLDAGVDARHLRGWRVAAEREAGLFDQLIQPLLRQRNPDANRQALEQLHDLEEVGGRLRSVLVHSALRHLFDG